MDRYLYITFTPESLAASMLPPEEFGKYLATGIHGRPHGPAIFVQLRSDFESEYFDLSNIDRRCVRHANGSPKHSVYMAIYRVLENVPLAAMKSLWLVTAHGTVLEIPQSQEAPETSGAYHLYQEICPVHPLIASTLGPAKFCRHMTDTSRTVSVPRICFVDLDLGGLAYNPSAYDEVGLPYHDMDHTRDCLDQLQRGTGKQTKIVDRDSEHSLLFRCVKSGFVIGDQEGMLHYPYPSPEEFQSKYYKWWHCANDMEIARL
jgi:hypothetical protein